MKKRIVSLLMLLCLASLLALPVSADQSGYLFDTEYLLDDMARTELEELCAYSAENYGCGIYIVTLGDFSEFGADARSAAEEIYRGMDFGVGENKNGILLMLSMAERDYALVSYGDIANDAFTDRNQIYIEDCFLDDLGANDWAGGLREYVEACLYVLENYEPGAEHNYSGYYEDGVYHMGDDALGRDEIMVFAVGIIIISLVIALVSCKVMEGMMKNTGIRQTAAEYIPQGGVHLRVREDRFTHRTTRVIYHDNDDDGFSGGTTVSSSGFSGRSGKF